MLDLSDLVVSPDWMRDALCSEPEYAPRADAWFPSTERGGHGADRRSETCVPAMPRASRVLGVRNPRTSPRGCWGGATPAERRALVNDGYIDAAISNGKGIARCKAASTNGSRSSIAAPTRSDSAGSSKRGTTPPLRVGASFLPTQARTPRTGENGSGLSSASARTFSVSPSAYRLPVTEHQYGVRWACGHGRVSSSSRATIRCRRV